MPTADPRADLAALLAVRERMTPGPWRSDSLGERSGFAAVFTGTPDGPGQTVAQWCLPDDAAGIVALRNAAPYLAALAHIAEIVEIRRGMDDGLTIDEIRAVLAGLEKP